ncbi:unnamed protein product [Protopolystoma xenopodis]|uniref:BEACH domain-containing protein n=1 Tax=Protopolystoma xenopodis TaxID=117903 RepID=A0A448WQ92_9PLAT|nr:unnamed protein product [Protopolystoma xenopodis]
MLSYAPSRDRNLFVRTNDIALLEKIQLDKAASYSGSEEKVHKSSLLDCIRYSPSKLGHDHHLLYIILQSFHRRNLPHASLHLDNIFISEDFIIDIGLPNPKIISLFYNINNECKINPPSPTGTCQISNSLSVMTWRWVIRDISNYDYCMFLNKMAGRRQGDPFNCAILPWVTDFTSQDGTSLRDLSQSKFRLTKGEVQLDTTYYSSMKDHLETVEKSFNPMCFDVSTSGFSKQYIPELFRSSCGFERYYSIDESKSKCLPTPARRTPKELLIRYVRPVYRPKEFPLNMARLYATTPDECIPEFFTDPTVFQSIHEDMPDLGIPEWCSNPEVFIKYHRDLLESDIVSNNLHAWFDLIFGFKVRFMQCLIPFTSFFRLMHSKNFL